MSMLIKLNGVSMAELESALKYSGLYVQTDEANPDYAEIKAIPQMIRSRDVDLFEHLKETFSRKFEKSEVSGE